MEMRAAALADCWTMRWDKPRLVLATPASRSLSAALGSVATWPYGPHPTLIYSIILPRRKREAALKQSQGKTLREQQHC